MINVKNYLNLSDVLDDLDDLKTRSEALILRKRLKSIGVFEMTKLTKELSQMLADAATATEDRLEYLQINFSNKRNCNKNTIIIENIKRDRIHLRNIRRQLETI